MGVPTAKVWNETGDTLTVEPGGTLNMKAGSTINLPAAGVTLGNISFAGLTGLQAAGRNAAGAITLTGATVGQRLVIALGTITNSTASNAFIAPAAGTFESVITVADQIQQASASDLSANSYFFVLAPAAAAE